MKVTCEAGHLAKFLGRVMSKGLVGIGKTATIEPLFGDCVIELAGGEAIVKSMDLMNTVMLHARIDGAEVEGEGMIAVSNIPKMVAILNTYKKKEKVTLEYPAPGSRVRGVLYNESRSNVADLAVPDVESISTNMSGKTSTGNYRDEVDLLAATPAIGPYKIAGGIRLPGAPLRIIETDAKDIVRVAEVTLRVSPDKGLEVEINKPNADVGRFHAFDVEFITSPFTFGAMYGRGFFSAINKMQGVVEMFFMDNDSIVVRDKEFGYAVNSLETS